MTLGQLLKTRREALGMTLEEVADATGCSKSYVWELENCKSYKVGLPLAARFAITLGLQISSMASASLESEKEAK